MTISGRLPDDGRGAALRAIGTAREGGRVENCSTVAPAAASNHSSLVILREAALCSTSMVTVPTTRPASAEREERFRQQMQAEAQKGKLLDRKFQEGLKKAKDSPDPPRRPFDYD